MIDLARIVALIAALRACLRARSTAGVAASTLIALIDAAVMIGPLASRTAPSDAGHAFVLAFWGPSRMPMPPTSLAWLDATLGRFPAIVPLVTTILAGAAAVHALRIAAPMRPESAPARTYDTLALRFALVAVIDGILTVIGFMTAHFVSKSL